MPSEGQLGFTFEQVPQRRIWRVADLVGAVRTTVERGYTDVWVEGEISNFRPSESGHLYFTLKDGDAQLAEEKQARLKAAVERMEGDLGIAGIKFGCDLNGYFGGRPRLPVLPSDGEQRAEIEALMSGLRN